MTVTPSAVASQTNDLTVDQNKANARRVLEEVFPANDETALRELIDDSFVNHEAPPGTPPGLGSVTMFMNLLASAFSDQRWTIDQVIAEGTSWLSTASTAAGTPAISSGCRQQGANLPTSRCT